MYGEDGIGKVKVTRGKRHDYLAMVLDFTETGVLGLDMRDYINQMILDFPVKMGQATCPWTEKLFKVDETAKNLGETRRQVFHSFVMKAMFLAKRGRQDI